MVKFKSPASSDDIVFIFLDRINQCQTAWTAELTKNLSDFVLSNILEKGFDVLQGIDEDLLLKEASKDYNHAVVLSTGTEFINGDEFFNELENFIYGNDYFLMGHIPNRDDGYYELHDQCYIINLSVYDKLGQPTVGAPAYYSSHEQIEPLRSEENIHDDYTPVWVSKGHTPKQYKHKWHGWNILSTAFSNDQLVLVFTEQFRKNKINYYPNYEPAFLKASTYLYGKNQVAAQTMFYPHNTEAVVGVNFKGPIRQLVTQASGLNWVDYLITYGYNSDTVVRFVDYNLFALECMKEITDNWDGTEYANFVSGYVNKRAEFLDKSGASWLANNGRLYDPDIAEWKHIKETVKFEFRHEDLVLNKSLGVSTWLDNVPDTIVHLSHIFNYDPVAPFVPLQHRIYSERMLLDKIKNYNADATVVMVDKAEHYKQRPTWHMNGDWNGL
jgi:hypothetical protein